MRDKINDPLLAKWPERHKNFSFWIATGFGSGLIHPAPGTWGSLTACVLVLPVLYLSNAPYLLLGMVFIAFALGVFSASIWEVQTGVSDDGRIVIDEFAGMWVSALPIPLLTTPDCYVIALLTAFLLFRFFDILKPFPIGYLDKKVKGGLGVMLDDIVAGAFATLILSVIILLWE